MQHHDTSQHSTQSGRPRSSQAHAADPWQEQGGGSADRHSGDVAGAAGRAYDRLEQTGSEVRSHLQRIVGDGQVRIADEIRTIGEAADAAADRLNDEEHARIGGYIHSIRRQCDRAARYLEERDAGSLLQEANDLARRNPALIIGGAAVIGLVAGRFLSARPPRPRGSDRDDWGSYGGGQTSGWGGGEPWSEGSSRGGTGGLGSAGGGSAGSGGPTGARSDQRPQGPGQSTPRAGTGVTGAPSGERNSSAGGSSSRPVGGTTGRPLGGSTGVSGSARPGGTGSSMGGSSTRKAKDASPKGGAAHTDDQSKD